MFNSDFSEGRLEVTSESPFANGDNESPQSPRRLVKIPDDFDLFHIVLLYLYTDRICFTTTPEKQFDIPVTDDAEGDLCHCTSTHARFIGIQGPSVSRPYVYLAKYNLSIFWNICIISRACWGDLRYVFHEALGRSHSNRGI